MLKHGRAGVPMEVMGLMLGEFVDDYTVRVIDVFAMPQSGTVSEKCNWGVRLTKSDLSFYVYLSIYIFLFQYFTRTASSFNAVWGKFCFPL